MEVDISDFNNEQPARSLVDRKVLSRAIRISDINIPELAIYRDLNEAQLRRFYEPEEGIFICESAKVIRRAIEADYEPISVLTWIEEPDEDAAFVFSQVTDAPIYLTTKSALTTLTGYHLTGGLLCAMRRKKQPSPEELCRNCSRIAVLEDVENPTNLGAIIRSAAAIGIEALLLTHDCTDPLYRRAARVSVGTVFQIPWVRLEKDFDYMAFLAAQGFVTVAMALSDDAVSIRDARLKAAEKQAILLGNENNGLRQDTIKRADYVAMIPMKNGVDSLNVAAASAVMFWEMAGE